ncbi:uncharacterized protein LOC126771672 [Nymphalis io]|uniref:uncharacterized protein LOC126771672 n=1 Tax=Inachis io TaxID=171585 RepID=UPI002168B04E|nr:uncharacterized protein LOC126771672 [Nymphalis io]
MRWSESETYEFVKLYFSHEHLWNNEHEHYKLNKLRLKSYRNIVSEFNTLTGISLTVSEIRGKIKNLRSTYTQELNKIKCRSGPHYTYEPTIKWFAYWHKRFQPYWVQKATDSNSTFEEPGDTDNESQKLWIANDTGNLSDDIHHSFVPGNNNDLTLFLKSEPEDSHLNQIVKRHRPHKIKRKKIKLHLSTGVSDEMSFSLQSNMNSVKEDEFEIYGKYIAMQLRTMDLRKALRLQIEIQSLIGKARLSDLSNQ